MHEIFISYRRIDTGSRVGHLYADLRRGFGDETVFMDTGPGGIAWGADWEKSLQDALGTCEVLIALIGPQWSSCERSPGVRRLDAPDDWVRCEIASVLMRAKQVLPVLLEGGVLQADRLPDELRTLRFDKHQAYSITESHWEADTARLVAELTKVPRLKQLRDLVSAQTGIRLLEQLIRSNGAVADAVSGSRAVIENADREVDEIRLLKNIHDALHEIESKCLIPIREIAAPLPLEAFRRKLAQQDHAICDALHHLTAKVSELPVVLDVDLPARLTAAADAFEVALKSHAPVDYDLVVGRLEELVGEIPVRLHDAIENAATRLDLQRLLELMATVDALLRPSAANDAELTPMLDGISALGELRRELALRVREHGLLQSLDNFLRAAIGGQRRAGTSGQIGASTLLADWNNIRRLRARFKAPFSHEVEDGHTNLAALEPSIDAAVARYDEADAVAQLHQYANEVGELFRLVDSKLKEFCCDLRERTRPLKTILDMCRVQVSHG